MIQMAMTLSLAITLFACEQHTSAPQDAVNPVTPTNNTGDPIKNEAESTDTRLPPAQEKTRSVIEAVIEPSMPTSDAKPEEGTKLDAAEAASAALMASQESDTSMLSTSGNSSQPTKNRLVKDLGFAGIEDNAPLNEPKSNYCLHTDNTSPEVAPSNLCKQISDRLASVSMQSCQNAKLRLSGCNSVAGFPILVREFPPLENKKPQGRILLIGGTHGDELTSVSVSFRWIEKLNKYHSGLFHWHIVPMMNPDGVLKREASRTNNNGIDLNRNLPSADWEENALHYWETKTGKNPRRYPGERASSEPETQWLIDEINHFKPDAIISVHAPYGVVDFDSLLLNTAPKSLGKLHLNLLGTYPGSLGNYAGINQDIPVITLELPHAWEMPSEKESTKIWEDIVAWLKNNIKT